MGGKTKSCTDDSFLVGVFVGVCGETLYNGGTTIAWMTLYRFFFGFCGGWGGGLGDT